MPELIPAEPLTPAWHAARRAGVTATDIVTILGLSSWDSAYSLYWRKMGQVPETPDNDRFRLGRYLEHYAVARWQEIHPTLGIGGSGMTWRHSDRPWQMATPDWHVIDHKTPVGVLECKTWADADRHSWDDGPPPKVRAQVLWQMDVMDVDTGHVGVVFLPSGEFRSYIIGHECPPDGVPAEPCDVCSDILLMRDAGHDFMARLRLELPPPDPDASAATLAAVRARFTPQPGKQADIDPELWRGYDSLCDDIESLKEEKREAEIQLREQAGEAQVLSVGGEPVARRVTSDAQVRAHVRHQDYIRRIRQQGGEDAADA